MNKKIISILIIQIILLINLTAVSANLKITSNENYLDNKQTKLIYSDNYNLQWEMNFGSDWEYGARYEGPQPIGDCDNDGKNEMLIGGRDGKIRVFEWDETKQTYLEIHTIFCPFYPLACLDPGGFAIGDLDGDGKNEIGATYGTSVHKWILGEYITVGFNNWIFLKGGGSADCYIGDYDNDRKNELIVSGGPMWHSDDDVPEIVIFRLGILGLVKEAEWNNPDPWYSYVYMAGLGDVDDDGENEIVCGSGLKFFVLDWNKDEKKFDETILETTTEEYYPFACVCKDSDGDGKLEIHLGYGGPKISIYEWNGNSYERKFVKEWYGEGVLIEGLDVGNVDYDPIAEVCAGTDVVHILNWDGNTYVEEAVLPTFGDLAVVAVGDCDNDQRNEIQVGSVFTDHEDFMSWVFKYNFSATKTDQTIRGNGRIKVFVKRNYLGVPINNASVAAWNLESGTWYDIQPKPDVWNTYTRNDLPEGEYLLRVHVEGYKNQETNVTIYAGQETTYTFNLLPKSLNRQIIIKNPFINLLTRLLKKIMKK